MVERTWDYYRLIRNCNGRDWDPSSYQRLKTIRDKTVRVLWISTWSIFGRNCRSTTKSEVTSRLARHPSLKTSKRNFPASSSICQRRFEAERNGGECGEDLTLSPSPISSSPIRPSITWSI